MSEYFKVQEEITKKNLEEMKNNTSLYNMSHMERYGQYFDFLNDYINSDFKILDVGCRDGGFLNFLKERNFKNLTGIEMIKEAVDSSIPEINILQMAAENLNFKTKFNLICFTHLLEHTQNPQLILKKAEKLLYKNKGFIFIEVPLEPIPDEIPTKWGHYYTFQTPKECDNLMSNLNMSFVKGLLDPKKGKWYKGLWKN